MRRITADQPGGHLYVVATPIGNLEEMPHRSISVLQQCDVIACEDTRHSRILTNRFSIHTPLIAHHAHNETQSTQGILSLLQQGKQVALISDAGVPLVNDPGQRLVHAAVDASIPVIPVGIPTAFLHALIGSGMMSQPFVFGGFLASTPGALRKQLAAAATLPYVQVYYLSVHKVARTLTVLAEYFNDRPAVLARELSKQHEEFIYTTTQALAMAPPEVKGELVLVVAGATQQKTQTEEDPLCVYQTYLEAGMTQKEALRMTVETCGIARNQLYTLIHQKDSTRG